MPSAAPLLINLGGGNYTTPFTGGAVLCLLGWRPLAKVQRAADSRPRACRPVCPRRPRLREEEAQRSVTW